MSCGRRLWPSLRKLERRESEREAAIENVVFVGFGVGGVSEAIRPGRTVRISWFGSDQFNSQLHNFPRFLVFRRTHILQMFILESSPNVVIYGCRFDEKSIKSQTFLLICTYIYSIEGCNFVCSFRINQRSLLNHNHHVLYIFIFYFK